jgi:hypothetical protein
VSIGHVERMGDHQKRGAIVWLEEGDILYIGIYRGAPYKVYNSVTVILYLKPFRTTGLT